jgi:hypothetical protein
MAPGREGIKTRVRGAVTVHGIDILRFEAGLLVDRWGQFEKPPSQ